MKVTDISFTPYTYKMLRTIGDVNLPNGVNEGMELAVFIHTDDDVLLVLLAHRGPPRQIGRAHV